MASGGAKMWIVIRRIGGSRRNWLEHRAVGEPKSRVNSTKDGEPNMAVMSIKEARAVLATKNVDEHWEILHYIGEYEPDPYCHLLQGEE